MSIFEPLPENYEFRDLQSLFGNSNTPTDIRDMYTRIFGTITNGTSHMREFSGAGRPDIIDNTVDPQIDTDLKITFNVTRHKVDTKIKVEYATDLNDIGTASSTKTGTFTYTTDGDKEITISVDAGLYYYRIEFWNAFNPTDADHEFTTTLSVELSDPTLATPSLLSTITYDSVDNEYNISWNTSGVEPTGYEINFQLNDGAWTGATSVTNKVNWDTDETKTKSADSGVDSIPNPGDVYGFRVRATKSGYTTSGWSNIESFTH